MPLTFIHTADWHLGHTYWRIGPRATQSRGWRFEAVRRIWELAAERNADFIVVAGDVFDTDTPTAAVRDEAIGLLADAPAPVYLISGNHDPAAQGSVWFHADFQNAIAGLANVKPTLQSLPLEIEGDTLLFPCPVERKYSRQDATQWIPPGARGERFRVGLAHGGWKGYFGGDEGVLNCISSDCAQRAGLDYLALGDYHSFTPADHAAAKARSFYAGTPEIGARDTARGGHALVVTLNQPGEAPRVKPHKVGKINLHDLGKIVLRGASEWESFKAQAQAIENQEEAIIRARFQGDVAPSLRGEVLDWCNQARESWLGADVTLDDLQAQPTRADFSELHLEKLEESLLEALDTGFDSEYLKGVREAELLKNWSGDPDARREALSLYYRLLDS